MKGKRILPVILILIASLVITLAGCNKGEGDSFTAEFVVDGNVIATATEGNLTIPADPSKTGYTFSGWFFEANNQPATSENLADFIKNGGGRIYAKFEIINNNNDDDDDTTPEGFVKLFPAKCTGMGNAPLAVGIDVKEFFDIQLTGYTVTITLDGEPIDNPDTDLSDGLTVPIGAVVTIPNFVPTIIYDDNHTEAVYGAYQNYEHGFYVNAIHIRSGGSSIYYNVAREPESPHNTITISEEFDGCEIRFGAYAVIPV